MPASTRDVAEARRHAPYTKVWLQLVATIGAALMTSSPGGAALAQDQSQPTLATNQAWIEGMQRAGDLRIESAKSAFELVFAQLPDEVFVFPTENYYYWRLTAGGVEYAGNLRLAAQDRDQGLIHFAAFRQANQASEAGPMMYHVFGSADGVAVEKVSDLRYRVSHKGKTVVFQLNDVSAIEPPKSIVADGEEYLGLVFDESGLRFFLFYNRRIKLFAYVLDETAPVLDSFEPIAEGSRIVVGHRTGFALYRHHHLERKVLFWVHDANTFVNNYHDGPADQLPENHIRGDNLREAIVDADPKMKDQLDTFGYLKSGEGRYLIAPYTQYQTHEELLGYETCAVEHAAQKDVYDGCFHSGDP